MRHLSASFLAAAVFAASCVGDKYTDRARYSPKTRSQGADKLDVRGAANALTGTEFSCNVAAWAAPTRTPVLIWR